MSAEKYGKFFWKVVQKKRIVMIHADYAEVQHGCLQLWHKADAEKDRPNILLAAFPSGSWESFFAASVIDGRAVCVDSSHDREKGD